MKKIILSLFLLSFANLIFSQQLFFQNIVGEGYITVPKNSNKTYV